jgi:crotonobetainyl-CoA:carnitine CoA-transferase CaiB-like acyl-CoA transferase
MDPVLDIWAPTDPEDMRPLVGLRVLEIGQYIAAPAAAQRMADMGADVIKIEPETGDASRRLGWSRDDFGPMFSAYNRNKRSVVLNLRDPHDQSVARALAMDADVLLHNARPGVMERLGLDAPSLMAAHPGLIYGAVSGFAPDGPMAERPGFDIAGQAESGMMSLNGEANADPLRVGFAVVDVMASHALTTGVLAALVRRGVRGHGALVEVSLVDAALDAIIYPWAEYRRSEKLPLRCGNGQPTVAPAADVIATADGMVVVSAYIQEHFLRLCECLGCPELVQDERFQDNPSRVRNRAALRAVLEQALGRLSTHEACQRLSAAGIVCGAVNTLADVQPGQGGLAGDSFVPVSLPGGPSWLLPATASCIDRQARQGGVLPALGEHTAQVLGALRAGRHQTALSSS